MSKENVQNNVEVTTAETLPEEAQVKKPGLLKRAFGATKRMVVKVRRSKAGRVIITTVELVGAGAVGYKFGFKRGAKSAVPAEVIINSGETDMDETIAEEEPAEDNIEEHD